MLLKKKTAVVTGCNRGIGKKILEIFSLWNPDRPLIPEMVPEQPPPLKRLNWPCQDRMCFDWDCVDPPNIP